MDQQSSSPPPGIVALYCRSFHLLNHTFLSSHFLLHLMVTIIKETSIFIANIITLLSTGLSDQHLNQKYQSWASRSSSTSRWFSFSIQFSIFNSRWIIISIRMILTDQNFFRSEWFSPIRIQLQNDSHRSEFFSIRKILTDQNSTSRWFSPIRIEPFPIPLPLRWMRLPGSDRLTLSTGSNKKSNNKKNWQANNLAHRDDGQRLFLLCPKQSPHH